MESFVSRIALSKPSEFQFDSGISIQRFDAGCIECWYLDLAN